jgi:hypothetical protein
MAEPAVAYPRNTPIVEDAALRKAWHPSRPFANFLELLARRVAGLIGNVATLEAGTARVLLASGSVSAAATLDLVLTDYTAYRGIVIELSGLLPATDGVDLYMRVSTDGGSAYDASGYNWAAMRCTDAGSSSGAGSGSANQMSIAGAADIGNAATEGIDVTVKIMGQTSTSRWSRARWDAYYIDNAGTPGGIVVAGGGAREAAQDTDAVRFLFSSGDIASGSYAVYGLA